MTKTYEAMYTVCIQEKKEFIFSDGTVSAGWTHPTDLWPNKIRSQVFDNINSSWGWVFWWPSRCSKG